MLPWQSGDITVNGVRLHYERTGSGEPALLFVHGLTDSAHYWKPTLDRLPATHECVIYDSRGHGRSEQPAEGYSTDQLADDLAGVIRGLGLAKPVVIGHSMGAATAALMAARYPDLARAIVLEDPPVGRGVKPEHLQAAHDDWRTDLRATKALDDAAKLAKAQANRPGWGAGDYAAWVSDKTLVAEQALDFIRNPGTPWYDLIEQVQCPILLITGDPAQGALVSPAFAKELAGRWKHGRVAQVADVGHSIRRGQPAEWAQAVTEFLAEV